MMSENGYKINFHTQFEYRYNHWESDGISIKNKYFERKQKY